MSESLFYDPAVLKVIRAILVSAGIRSEPDLEDAIGEVVLACIEHVRKTGRPPKDVAEAIAIARPIARGDGLDAARKRARRSKRNPGLTAQADDHAQERQPSVDPVDEARMFSAIRQVLKDDQIEALADVGAGVPQAELATERRASQAATRKRVQRYREKALGALSAKGYWVAGGFAALLAGVIAVYAGALREPDVSRAHPAGERPQELAAEQRRLAADRCKEKNWDECEKALDRAARLDAEGERGAQVAALRKAIAAGRLEDGGQAAPRGEK
jgi:hypothetical protein